MTAQIMQNPIAGTRADAILGYLGIDREIQIYHDLPHNLANGRDQRRVCAENVRQAKIKLEQTKDDLELQDAILLAEIAEEVDEKGKAKYSNPESRKAALLQRRATSTDYKQAKVAHAQAAEAVARAEGALMAAEDAIKNMGEQFRAIETIVDLTGKQLALITRHAEV